ncbi:carboxypeptidase-like regulatory domain-containing protein [Sphingomonas sp. MMS24-JH45]
MLAPTPAAAQTSTAQLRGQVRGADGAAVGGATVVAVNIGTNQTIRGVTDANGAYALTGLRPATYDVTITGASGERFTRRIIVSVGQSGTLDATLGAASPAPATEGEAPAPETNATAGDIVVTGSRLRETRTSEIATNVTQQQIRTLPQTDRNFLTFAALAPGVRYNDGEFGQGLPVGRGDRQPGQRLHRRRQPEEQAARRRRRRAAEQPRQSLRPARRAGIPRPDAELQGRVRTGRFRDHHVGDEVGDQ